MGDGFATGSFGKRADDKTASGIASAFLHDPPQAFPFALFFDLGRDAEIRLIGHKHEIAGWNGEVGGQTRALATKRVFNHLNNNDLTLAQAFVERIDTICVALCLKLVGASDVGHMQKSRSLEADVNKRRLHAGQHPSHLAEINITDQTALARPFDQHLREHPVFNVGNPRLLRGHINQEFFGHACSGV